MDIKKVYEKLLIARRPKDFFGDIDDVQELHKKYKEICKYIHPDVVKEKDYYLANETFIILNRLYVQGLNEYDNGVYHVETSDDEYKKSLPIFQVQYGDNRYVFFKRINVGEVAEIYEGTCGNVPMCIKIPLSSEDGVLIEKEYKTLSNLHHQSLPYVQDKFIINGSTCFTMRKIDGERTEELIKRYPNGISAEHVLWMIERLLSVVGFLHIHNIVHGNIKPENIIINKQNHNVTLTGFSFVITNANKKSARYQIVNPHYTAEEVNKDSCVEPSTDIYSIGKVAVFLMGGNVEDGTLPETIDANVRNFICAMISKDTNKRPNDAWKLYKKLQELRTQIYGTERFKPLT